MKGTDVSIEDALTGCQRILNDEFRDYPESAFYMIGKLDEATLNSKANGVNNDRATEEGVKV